MLSYFALCSWTLLLSFWRESPQLGMLVVLFVHILELGLFETLGAATTRDALVFGSLTILLYGQVGWMMGVVIEKPTVLARRMRTAYVLFCLLALGVWIGTGLAWQYAPQTWWNYLFVVLVPQLLTQLISLLFVRHNEAWGYAVNGHESLLVHYHFFMLWLFQVLPFFVAQLVNRDGVWPFYLVMASTLTSALWIAINSNCRRLVTVTHVPEGSDPIVLVREAADEY